MEQDQATAIQQRAGAPTERFLLETGAAAGIAALVEPVLEDMGFRLVRVAMSKRDGATIQIMVDKAGGSIVVQDCADISRRLSPLLDVHDPIKDRYYLEVSSPGIDRILVRPSDFEDWAGYEVKVELKELIDGRKRFRGILEGYADGEMRLVVMLDENSRSSSPEGGSAKKAEPEVIGLPVDLIHDAKLVLTDELIRASLARAKAQGQKWAEGGELEEPDLNDSELNDGPSRD
ncbi:MAG: ribosome maturation factor RimP [Rhodomicrobium sp.]